MDTKVFNWYYIYEGIHIRRYPTFVECHTSVSYLRIFILISYKYYEGTKINRIRLFIVYVSFVILWQIDHLRYVDFRSAVWLPCDHRSVANTDTRFEPNILGRACVFSVWRPVWTASVLSGSLIRCSAPKMEDAIIRSAHRRWRACFVRYDVASSYQIK